MMRIRSLRLAEKNVHSRRGAVLVVAMVALIVSTAVTLSMVRSALAERALVLSEADRMQTDWLVEAGLERAAARLASEPDYSGEVWKPTAAEFPIDGNATVTITIQTAADPAGGRRVTATAVLIREQLRRAERQKTITINLSTLRENGI